MTYSLCVRLVVDGLEFEAHGNPFVVMAYNNKGKDMQTHFRQGDVLLVKTRQKPSADARHLLDRGRTILAYGEVTGHAHQVIAADLAADLVVANPDPVPAQQLFQNPDGTRLLVLSRPAALVHEEHARIDLPVGTFEVRRQAEYSLDQVRQVAD